MKAVPRWTMHELLEMDPNIIKIVVEFPMISDETRAAKGCEPEAIIAHISDYAELMGDKTPLMATGHYLK